MQPYGRATIRSKPEDVEHTGPSDDHATVTAAAVAVLSSTTEVEDGNAPP